MGHPYLQGLFEGQCAIRTFCSGYLNEVKRRPAENTSSHEALALRCILEVSCIISMQLSVSKLLLQRSGFPCQVGRSAREWGPRCVPWRKTLQMEPDPQLHTLQVDWPCAHGSNEDRSMTLLTCRHQLRTSGSTRMQPWKSFQRTFGHRLCNGMPEP